MNDDDRKAYIGEDAKHIDREHLYTAQEARIEQLKRETVEMPCHFFCYGKDRFGNECFAELKLVLDKHSKYVYRLKSRDHIKGCDQAIEFKESQEDSDYRISKRISTFSIRDFYTAISKGYNYDHTTEAPDGNVYREPRNLEELYEKLSGAQIHMQTRDRDLDVSDIFYSSKTYRLYRESKKIHGLMLVIAMTAYDSTIVDTCKNLFPDNELWLMQDPYEYTYNESKIYFMLYGEKKSSKNPPINQIAIRTTAQSGIDSNGKHQTNNSLYLIIADWMPIDEFINSFYPNLSEEDYKLLLGRRIVMGYIRNMKQFNNLTEPVFREDLKCFHERISRKYYEARW